MPAVKMEIAFGRFFQNIGGFRKKVLPHPGRDQAHDTGSRLGKTFHLKMLIFDNDSLASVEIACSHEGNLT